MKILKNKKNKNKKNRKKKVLANLISFDGYSPNFVISFLVSASSRLVSFSMAVMLTLVLFPGGPRGPLFPGSPLSPEGPGRPRRPRGPCSPGGPGGPKITVLRF